MVSPHAPPAPDELAVDAELVAVALLAVALPETAEEALTTVDESELEAPTVWAEVALAVEFATLGEPLVTAAADAPPFPALSTSTER